MSLKSKKKEFHFNLSVLFRWLFFALIIYLSINYLSKNNSNINLSSKNYPANLNIAGVSTKPLVNEATKTFEYYKNEAINYLNDQYIDLKKQIITKVYEDIIKSIDNSNK